MIELKEGVRFISLPTPMLRILTTVDLVWKQKVGHLNPTITAGFEPTGHMTKSYHYLGYAIDVRSKDLTKEEKLTVLAALKDALRTPDYDVLLEHLGEEMEHFHIEYNARQIGSSE